MIVHGTVDHSGVYSELGQFLAAQGVAVFASDMRGWGRSDGEPLRHGGVPVRFQWGFSAVLVGFRRWRKGLCGDGNHTNQTCRGHALFRLVWVETDGFHRFRWVLFHLPGKPIIHFIKRALMVAGFFRRFLF